MVTPEVTAIVVVAAAAVVEVSIAAAVVVEWAVGAVAPALVPLESLALRVVADVLCSAE
jgi:hypothetical protein